MSLDIGDGQMVELSADDILIQRTEKEGMTVANEDDITVALDTRLSPELIQEGWAREIVSKLQNLRKELRFEVTDRIRVVYDAPTSRAGHGRAVGVHQRRDPAVSMTPGALKLCMRWI